MVSLVKSGLLEIQAYMRLLGQTMRGIFTPPFYFHDIVEQFELIGVGSLTVVLLTDNKTRSLGEHFTTTGILVLCLVILFVMFAAAAIFRVLGRPGVEIVSRVFGLILASIAVTSLVIAIKMSFGLSLG